MEMKEKQVGKLFIYTDPFNPKYNRYGIVSREINKHETYRRDIIRFRSFSDGDEYWMGSDEVVIGEFVIESKPK